jgi:hypothetical protein
VTWTIRLPWPAKSLWPNGRAHWGAKANATKKARADGMIAAVGAKVPRGRQCRYRLHIEARPKKLPQGGGAAPDTDNIVSACKAYRDGIADAMGVDDALFDVAPPVIGERVHNGQIIITVEAME